MAQIRSKQIRDFLSTVDWNQVTSSQIANASDVKDYVDSVEAALGSEVNASIDSLESALSLEISATNVDVASLDIRVLAEEDRLTAVLDAVGANPDSFADVVSIINAVDTENDDALAVVISNLNVEIAATNGDVTSIDARILADEAALEAEISTTNLEVAALQAKDGAQDVRMDGIDGTIAELEAKHDSEMEAHHIEHLSLIAAEEARAISEEARIEGLLADEISETNVDLASLDARVLAEEQALSAEISTTNFEVASLDTRVLAEEDRLTAVLDAVGANPDSFADVVSIINAVDLENDNALAAVISNLNSEISSTNVDLTSVDNRMTGIEGDLTDEISTTNVEVASLASALTAEISATNVDFGSVDTRMTSADTRMTGIDGTIAELEEKHDTEMLAHHNEHLSLIAAEEARAIGVEGSLETRLQTEEGARAAADTALSGRIDTLEATIQEDNEQFVDTFSATGTPAGGLDYVLTNAVQDDNAALVNAYVNGHRVAIANVAGVTIAIADPGYAIDGDDTVVFVYQF